MLSEKLKQIQNTNKQIKEKINKANFSKKSLKSKKDIDQGFSNFYSLKNEVPKYTSLKNPLSAQVAEISEEIKDDYNAKIKSHSKDLEKLKNKRSRLMARPELDIDILKKLLRVNNVSTSQMKSKIVGFLKSRAAVLQNTLQIRNKIQELRQEKIPKIKSSSN